MADTSDFQPVGVFRNGGPNDLAMERFKLRELAEGWPMYRDACEWENLASIFDDDAYIYTTWTGRTHFQDFIRASRKGMEQGVFIMHRCHGMTTDINSDATRAITKMKATITQRFQLKEGDVDAESDCRFCFFWGRNTHGEWKAKYVRHWYEKDKLIPITPGMTLKLEQAKLETYPSGYRHLAYLQEATMGVNILLDMPGHRREHHVPDGNKLSADKHDMLYMQCKAWVEGAEVDI